METSALQGVIEHVKLRDVWLLSGRQDTYSDPSGQLETQWRHKLKNVTLFDVDQMANYPTGRALRIELQVGARWIAKSKSRKTKTQRISPESVKQPDEVAFVEGNFAAEYAVLAELDESGLGEFAEKNAYLHVWPFAREYLCSMASRMNLPKCVLPAIQFARRKMSPIHK